MNNGVIITFLNLKFVFCHKIAVKRERNGKTVVLALLEFGVLLFKNT